MLCVCHLAISNHISPRRRANDILDPRVCALDRVGGLLVNQLLDFICLIEARLQLLEKLAPSEQEHFKESSFTTRANESAFSTISSCTNSGQKPTTHELRQRLKHLDVAQQMRDTPHLSFTVAPTKRKRKLSALDSFGYNDGQDVLQPGHWKSDTRFHEDMMKRVRRRIDKHVTTRDITEFKVGGRSSRTWN